MKKILKEIKDAHAAPYSQQFFRHYIRARAHARAALSRRAATERERNADGRFSRLVSLRPWRFRSDFSDAHGRRRPLFRVSRRALYKRRIVERARRGAPRRPPS